MDMIRPISDLRDDFAEISRIVHETARPVFLTKDGYGDMVVLSMEAFEDLRLAGEIDTKLREAEQEAGLTGRRYSSREVLEAAREAIQGG